MAIAPVKEKQKQIHDFFFFASSRLGRTAPVRERRSVTLERNIPMAARLERERATASISHVRKRHLTAIRAQRGGSGRLVTKI